MKVVITVNNKNAINFLLFSYFGITLCSDREEIIDAAIKRAYIDATNQAAFNTLIGKQSDDLKEQAKSTKCNASKIIKNFINNEKFDYDKKHSECCRQIVLKYKNMELGNYFSYGNAQNG